MHEYRLIIIPSDLQYDDAVRYVSGDDEQSRRTWAEIDRRALESYERSRQEHMNVLEEMGNMPLD